MKKNCIKSDFKEISLKLAKMGKVIRPFCWHQNFVPWGQSVPALGLYTCIKSWKKMYKSRLQRDFWGNLQQMTEVTRCSCWHQNFVPKGLSAPALGLYRLIKIWKKKCIKLDYKEIFLKLVANDRSDKFSVDIKILSTGDVCPWPASIYIY